MIIRKVISRRTEVWVILSKNNIIYKQIINNLIVLNHYTQVTKSHVMELKYKSYILI